MIATVITVALVMLSTPTPWLELDEHSAGVSVVGISPNGSIAFTGGRDNTLRLWDLRTGKQLRQLPWKPAPSANETIRSGAFCRKGKLIIAGGQMREMGLWNVATGKELRIFRGRGAGAFSVAFSPDGTRAVSGEANGHLHLWNIDDGTLLKRTNSPLRHEITSLDFSPDGKRLVLTDFGPAPILWDVEKWEQTRTFGDGHIVRCAVFSPDGKYVLAGGWDKMVRLWNATNGEEVAVFKGHTGKVHCIAYCPKSERIASGGDDGTIRIWDVKTTKELLRISGQGTVVSVAFSPNGELCISASGKIARVWKMPKPSE